MSLAFYTDLLGFAVLFARPEMRFAYLGLGDAQLMLEQYAEGKVGKQSCLSLPSGGVSTCNSKLKALAYCSRVWQGLFIHFLFNPERTDIAKTACCTAIVNF